MEQLYQIWRFSLNALPRDGVEIFIRQAALAGVKCYRVNDRYLVMLFQTPRSLVEVMRLTGSNSEDCQPGNLRDLPVEV